MRTLIRPLFVLVVSFLAFASATPGQLVYDGNQNLPPFGTFSGSDFDLVSLQNGNLHLHIPIATWAQRGGKTIHLSFVYDTRSWTRQTTTTMVNGQRIYITTLLTNPQDFGVVLDSGSWEVSSPIDSTTCKNGNVYHNWVVTDPEGTKHPLDLVTGPGLAGCMGLINQSPTTDGSGMMVSLGSSPPLLTLKDGTQIVLSKSSDYVYTGFTGIEDTNGNLVNSTDTLNRSLVTTTQGSGYTLYTITDSNGASQIYRLDYNAPSGGLHTDFCGDWNNPPTFRCTDTVSSSTNTALGRLTLPDGSFYQFSWANAHDGELQSVTLPTGATISYTYNSACTQGPLVNGETTITGPYTCRATVASRTVTVNGAASTWNYGNAVTDPNGNDEVYVFSQIVVNNVGSAGTYETSVSYYQGSASTGKLLKQVVTDYTGEPDLLYVSNTLVNVRPIRVTTTLDNGFVRKTETDYETFTLAENGNTITATRLNPTEIREYEYASGAPGPLLRRTDYTYLHNNNSTYASLNIVDRPASVTVYDGSGNLASQTTYEYDVYNHSGLPAMQSSGAVQHDLARGTSYTTRGNLTGTSKWVNTTSSWLTTLNQYDDAGNTIATMDPRSNITSLDYTDSWNNTTCAPSGQGKAYPTTLTNALGQLTKSTFNSCTGTLASKKDQNDINANRVGTTFSYDLLGRVTSVNYPDGGQTTNCYTDVGGATCTLSGPPFQVVTTRLASPSPNQTVTNFYDGLGRPIEKLMSDPDCSTGDRTDTTYDGLGRVLTLSNPYCSTSDPTYGLTTYTYDAIGRACAVAPPMGTPSRHARPAQSQATSLPFTRAGQPLPSMKATAPNRLSGLRKLTGWVASLPFAKLPPGPSSAPAAARLLLSSAQAVLPSPVAKTLPELVFSPLTGTTHSTICLTSTNPASPRARLATIHSRVFSAPPIPNPAQSPTPTTPTAISSPKPMRAASPTPTPTTPSIASRKNPIPTELFPPYTAMTFRASPWARSNSTSPTALAA